MFMPDVYHEFNIIPGAELGGPTTEQSKIKSRMEVVENDTEDMELQA